ncbi:Uncharacterised protein [BD1-7 clade bacterium]|uniref:KTSC domain-containing protein n=1 Tax=BD1-7 clade bacterium TaxID=2029982 RepID=A0A5S9Q8R2_9GAMM|nr:Uncharacterised protein [BD1-7 clade bacterium]CAA0113745.1 Uncharacterised protein [BD1-7 clade bacterium]
MQRYSNLGGDSNVVSYEIGPDYIKVQFSSGSPYIYTYASAGAQAVQEMCRLARAGHGLNSYIMRFAKHSYAR